MNATLEPGTYLPIEQFPILKLIPDRFVPSKARAKRCYKEMTAIWTEARRRVEERRLRGDKRDSVADKVLAGDIKLDVPLSDTHLNNFLGVIHEGSADTVSGAILTTILHLAKNPWVQHKARVELDRVCGVERVPIWSDFENIPYINCIIKEGLRIRPV
jgi:cytochrome P450